MTNENYPITKAYCDLRHKEVDTVKDNIIKLEKGQAILFDRMWKAALAIIGLLVCLLGERVYSHRDKLASINVTMPEASAAITTQPAHK